MGPDSAGITTIQVFNDDFSLNQHESFNIYGFPDQDIEHVESAIEEHIYNTNREPPKKHAGHTFYPIKDYPAIDSQDPPKCGECGLFVFGLLFLGYRCDQCEKHYHEMCFKDGNVKISPGMFFKFCRLVIIMCIIL